MKRIIMVLIAALLTSTSCGLLNFGDITEELNDNRQNWQNLSIASYTYHFQRQMYTLSDLVQWVEIEVSNGNTVSVNYIDTNYTGTLDSLGYKYFLNVDELFDEIQKAIDNNADALEVEFHPTMYYPTLVSIDPSKNFGDDEVIYLTSNMVKIN